MAETTTTMVNLSRAAGVVTVELARGKVNALNDALVRELHRVFDELAADPAVRAVVVTGRGKFFSFGWDVPEFMSWSPEEFTGFLVRFTDLYRAMFGFPKPLVCAINGHAVAGGCMLATACDERLMVTGRARISLNEVTFGSSVPAGSVDMLIHWVGAAGARDVLLSGDMLSADEARAIGLVDQVTDPPELAGQAAARARALAARDARACRALKTLLRGPTLERMAAREPEGIREFVRIWYSPGTRAQLEAITIRA